MQNQLMAQRGQHGELFRSDYREPHGPLNPDRRAAPARQWRDKSRVIVPHISREIPALMLCFATPATLALAIALWLS